MRDGDIISPKINFSEPMKNQALEFVAAIGQNRRPVSDGITGTDVVMTLQAIEASIRERGRAVEVGKWKVASRSN